MEVRLVKGMEEFEVLQLSILSNGQEILVCLKKDHQPATFTFLNFPVDD
ncbi:hypothetical protein [Marinilabilia sp.]|nr:hypothetical protein [Marinilabilia sp.]